MKQRFANVQVALLLLLGSSGALGQQQKDCRRYSNYWTRSAKSCEELIEEGTIPNLSMIGTEICQTATPQGSCLATTYSEGVDLCQSIGMRLCRFVDEMPAVSNCRLGAKRFWYENPCGEDSHMSGERLNMRPSNPACSASGNTLALVCCADSDTTKEVGNECASCPANSYRDESSTTIIGSSSCKCKDGYVAQYADQDIASCTRSTDSQFKQCPANKFATRTAEQCDGPNGLIATRGYQDKGSFCSASFGAMDGTTCPPKRQNSWYDADAFCAAAGARLCTSEEIKAKAWRGTNTPECRNIQIGDEVATSTKCTQDGTKALVWTRRSPSGGSFSCLSKSSRRSMSVLCCADPGTTVQCRDCPANSIATAAASEDDCTCEAGRSGNANMCKSPPSQPPMRPTPTCDENEYLFTPSEKRANRRGAARRGFRMVGGFSPKVDGACQNGKTKSEAEAICALKGARLCTATELYRGETRGTGCGFDTLYIWSSTPCCTAEGTCGQDKYMVVVGKGEKTRMSPKQQCVSASTRYNVRCCTDVNLNERCRTCPANSESPSGSTSITQCSCAAGYWGRNGGECTPV